MPPKRASKPKTAGTAAKAQKKSDQNTFITANVDMEVSRKLPFFADSGDVYKMQHAWMPSILRWEMKRMPDHPWQVFLKASLARSIISKADIIQHVGWHNLKNL